MSEKTTICKACDGNGVKHPALSVDDPAQAMCEACEGHGTTTEPMVSIPRAVLEALAPQEAIIHELGGCVWCCKGDYYRGQYEPHDPTCPWLTARRLLGDANAK